MDLLTIKTPKQNVIIKKFTCKGTWRQVLIRVYRQETQSVMLDFWYFDPALWTIAPLTFSLIHLPPSPFPVSKYMYTVYRQCVSGRRWGVLSCVGDHFRQVLYLTRFRTYKIARPTPKQKPMRGRGLRQINSLPQSPFTGKFFRWRHFALLSISLIFLQFISMLALHTPILWDPDLQCGESIVSLVQHFWLPPLAVPNNSL